MTSTGGAISRVGGLALGAPETGCFYVVELVERHKYLVLRSTTHLPRQLLRKPGVEMEWTWGFYLDELDAGYTRLVVRVRGTLRPWWLLATYRLFIVPADFVMGRSFCRGIKARSEGSRPSASEPDRSERSVGAL